VTLQLQKGARLLPVIITQDPRNRQLGVVVENAAGYRSEVGEGANVAFQKRLRGLGGKSADKTVVGMRQIEDHEVRLTLDARDRHQGFAEIGLRFAWRMRQRHEHLLAAELRLPYIVLHDGVATGEVMLGP